MTTTVPRERAGEVDPRFEARRRQVAADRRRRWVRRGVVLGAVVAVLAATWGLTRTGALDVDVIDVAGAARLDHATVVQASGVAVGDPLLDVDPADAAAGIEALPWIADAVVERDWRAGHVRITVQERTPVAAVVAGAAVGVVDADGHVLAVGSLDGPPPAADGLVRVEGPALGGEGTTLDPVALPLLEVASALTPGVRTRVVAVRPAGDEVELTLQPAGTVRFGPAEDVAEKVRSLQTVLAEAQLDCLAAIDVRVPDTAVLTRDPACG